MSGNNDAPLSFDPNEHVVPYAVESVAPMRRTHQQGAGVPHTAHSGQQIPQTQSSAVQTQAPQLRGGHPVGTQPSATPTKRAYAATQFREGAAASQPQKQATQPQTQMPAAQSQRPVARPAAQPVRAIVETESEIEAPVAVAVSKHKPALPLTHGGQRVITPAFEDVWLPSNFVAYPWKDIQVRRFNVEEIRAIVRARTSGNLRHLIRAVDSTISRPITELTVGDFWYLMYWHRLNSYKKSPFVIEWVCKDHNHVGWVQDGYRPAHEHEQPTTEDNRVPVDSKTLRNLLTVNRSNLATQEIDADKYEAIRAELLAEYGVYIRPQSLVDFVSASDEDDELETQRKTVAKRRREAAEKAVDEGDVDALINLNDELEALGEEYIVADEERSFSYRYAALLGTEHGESLQQRVEWLNQQDPDLLVDLERALELSDHGVNESWEVKCKECGASTTVTQSLDALTFLPSLQRGGLA